MFHESTCIALPAIRSDHSPLLFNIMKGSHHQSKKHHLLRYELAWEQKASFTKVIKKAWDSGRLDNDIHIKLRKCEQALKKWRKDMLNKDRQKQREFLAKIDRLQADKDGEHIEDIKVVQLELQSHLEDEEARWN